MTTQMIAAVLGVQHELVRDAAGSLRILRAGRLYLPGEVLAIRLKLVAWDKLPARN